MRERLLGSLNTEPEDNSVNGGGGGGSKTVMRPVL